MTNSTIIYHWTSGGAIYAINGKRFNWKNKTTARTFRLIIIRLQNLTNRPIPRTKYILLNKNVRSKNFITKIRSIQRREVYNTQQECPKKKNLVDSKTEVHWSSKSSAQPFKDHNHTPTNPQQFHNKNHKKPPILHEYTLRCAYQSAR